ncbi:MAG: biopolymer transporter ExbD [Rhodobiaceae bacterium]|nr:biopolymer transporter ExbD [Rhodobiaceae bacterium]
MVLRQPRSKLVLSLTPLIDVVFILLIFFMLASQFVDWRQIKLTPQAQFSEAVGEEQTLSLILQNDGSFMLDGQAVEGLQLAIAALISHGKNRTVFIEPEEDVEIQSVIDMIEALNASGFTKVQLSDAVGYAAP